MRRTIGVLLFVGAHALGAQPRFKSRVVDSVVSGSARIVVTATDLGAIIVAARAEPAFAAAFLETEKIRDFPDSIVAIARAAGRRAAGEQLNYVTIAGGEGGIILRRVVGDASDKMTVLVETPLDASIRIFIDVRPGQAAQMSLSNAGAIKLADIIRRALGVSRAMSEARDKKTPP